MAKATEKEMVKELEKLGYRITKPNYFRCISSGKELSLKQNHFYQTNNPNYAGCIAYVENEDNKSGLTEINVLPFSKGEIERIYNNFLIETENDEKLAMYKTSKEIRIPWIEDVWCIAESSNTAKWKTYIWKSNSLPQYSSLTIKDSEEYIGEIGDSVGDISKQKAKSITRTELKQMVDMFGDSYTEEQLIFLWEDYYRLINSYDSDTYALQLLFKDIAYLNLQIEEEKKKNGNIDKLIKTRQSLLGDANIKPSQESSMNSTDANVMGVLIKKMENERPASDPDAEWEDANIVKLSQLYAGQMARIENIQGDLLNNYKAFLEEFSVEMGNEEDE